MTNQDDMTKDSPRLPDDIRSVVFDAVFDIVEKFNFPTQNGGPSPDVVEIGDVCAAVEKKIIAILRADAIAAHALENNPERLITSSDINRESAAAANERWGGKRQSKNDAPQWEEPATGPGVTINEGYSLEPLNRLFRKPSS